jgi:hypothetical protein
MKDPVDRAVRAIARRQPFALLWAQFSEEGLNSRLSGTL